MLPSFIKVSNKGVKNGVKDGVITASVKANNKYNIKFPKIISDVNFSVIKFKLFLTIIILSLNSFIN